MASVFGDAWRSVKRVGEDVYNTAVDLGGDLYDAAVAPVVDAFGNPHTARTDTTRARATDQEERVREERERSQSQQRPAPQTAVNLPPTRQGTDPAAGYHSGVGRGPANPNPNYQPPPPGGPHATTTNQSREAQLAAQALVLAAAQGTGPSAAETQSRIDQDRLARSSLALTAAVQGRSVGGALRAAGDMTARGSAEISANAQAERAREMAAARSLALAGSGQIRELDVREAENAERFRVAREQLDADYAIRRADLQLRAAQGDQQAAIELERLDNQYAIALYQLEQDAINTQASLAGAGDQAARDTRTDAISAGGTAGGALLKAALS